MPESMPDLLIVGGGVAGWAAAVAARRAGRSVALLSRDRLSAAGDSPGSAGARNTGSAAAGRSAAAGNSLAIADGWIEWLHADAEALLRELGADIKKAVRGRTQRLVFLSADAHAHAQAPSAHKQAAAASKDPPTAGKQPPASNKQPAAANNKQPPAGHRQAVCDNIPLALADCAGLRAALRTVGLAAGVEHLAGRVAAAVAFDENRVRVRTQDGAEHAASMLIFADGAATLAASHVRLRDATAASQRAAPHYVAQATLDKPRKAAAAGDGGELFVTLAAGAPPGFGYAVAADKRMIVGWVDSAAPQECAARLTNFVARSHAAWGLSAAPLLAAPAIATASPSGSALQTGADPIRCRAIPRGAALDCDTHVGKHCLVIGDAGGFVGAFGQDGVYPALRSALTAAATVHAALDARHPQDVLAGFDAAWRGELAEYIRMPGVDIKMMLPMIFTNKTIAARIAQAFALGRKSDRAPVAGED